MAARNGFHVLVRGSFIDITSGIGATTYPAILLDTYQASEILLFVVSFPKPQNEFDAASSG